MSIGVGYLYDEDMHAAANARGENYWYYYIEEILDELGIRAEALPFSALQTDRLESLRALFLGDFDALLLPAQAGERLCAWVESGGTLIGFKTTGLDGPIADDWLPFCCAGQPPAQTSLLTFTA